MGRPFRSVNRSLSAIPANEEWKTVRHRDGSPERLAIDPLTMRGPTISRGKGFIEANYREWPPFVREFEAAEVSRRWPEIAIVFATGMNWGPDLMDASRTALLQKPFGPEDLLQALERAVSGIDGI